MNRRAACLSPQPERGDGASLVAESNGTSLERPPHRRLPITGKVVYSDYAAEIHHQREIWRRKPALRILYRQWYGDMLQWMGERTPLIEIGAGCGNLKEFCPRVLATDVVNTGPWLDCVLDAQNLSVAANSVGGILAVDVIHHLQRPLNFLRQACAALKSGGRLVLCEPAATPWSRLVYGAAHHERLDLTWDLFGLDGQPLEPDPGHTFANMGIAELLFWRNRAETLSRVPSLSVVHAGKFGFLLYPLTGGFNYRCFVPQTRFESLLKLEDLIMRPFSKWLTGMRMLVVLEKRG
jgi:hypothetical protein